MDQRVEKRSGGLSLEGQNSRSHFIEYDPKRKQVRARTQRRAQRRLRRHVRDGSQGGCWTMGAPHRLRVPEGGATATDFVAPGELRQTEIQNLGVAERGDRTLE